MSLIGNLLNRAPVSYTSSKGSTFSVASPMKSSRGAQLASMGHNGTLFAIVDATSQGTASAKWKLYRKARSGRDEDRVEVTAHAALDCLRKPNDFFTQQEMFESGQQHADLTGETWLVVSRSTRSSVPLELWVVRPDRMEPVASSSNYLLGYIYNGPDGEKVPLGLDEVIFMRRPHPEDPYRGIGPVQSVLTDLDAAKYSAEWNKNFFLNSAEPGGIIEVDRRLGDDEWREMRARWQEQHQGVAQAHRVALLEQGKWVDRKFSQRDMQFSELRNVSRELIRESFRFPVSMLGTAENVNRANALAAEVVFGRWLLVPRLDRWKGALNNDFLPMFYPPGTRPDQIDLEFDYERSSVVPDDKEADAAELKAKVDAAKILIDLGFDALEVMESLELPTLTYTKPAAPVAPPPPEQAPPVPGAPGGAAARLVEHIHPSFAGEPLVDAPRKKKEPKLPDLSKMQEDWDATLDHLLEDFVTINQQWRDELLAQIQEMASSGSLLDLLNLKVDASSAASLLETAMVELNEGAAKKVVDEAAEMGRDILPGYTRRSELSVLAQVVMSQLASDISTSAGREALRVSGSATSADDVVLAVRNHLDELTDARLRLAAGGALTAAQHSGRMSTMLSAPEAAYYSSEVLDGNTCEFCAAVNKRWLGNSLTEAQRLYPRAGYIDCKGGIRCRGTIVAVWRPEQSNEF